MASISARGARGPIVGINVTPLVDVVLVLLIIMMVSATYIVSQSLKVELPKTATSDETSAKTYVVTISKDGKYSFNDRPSTEAALSDHFKKARKETKNVTLVVTADQAALHGKVVGVIDRAKLEGIGKFAINVERK